MHVIVDKRRIVTYVDNNEKHIQFDNKEYIITTNKFTRDELHTQCANFGSEYKSAYINYKEEYEM